MATTQEQLVSFRNDIRASLIRNGFADNIMAMETINDFSNAFMAMYGMVLFDDNYRTTLPKCKKAVTKLMEDLAEQPYE